MQFVVLLSEHVPHNADDGDAYDSIPKTAYEEIETDAHQTKKGDLVELFSHSNSNADTYRHLTDLETATARRRPQATAVSAVHRVGFVPAEDVVRQGWADW